MTYFGRGFVAAALIFRSFQPIFAQELPQSLLSMTPREERYCAADFRDLNGKSFRGIIKTERSQDGRFFYFRINEEHPTYKLPPEKKKDAFEYGTQRGTISADDVAFNNSRGDVITFDGQTFFGDPDPEKSQIKGDALRLYNEVAACAVTATK